ncbi:5-(carboxyamino)imidazole ribonucleotide synthase [Roseateles oligotrophus]|uniref:N5-carboxyaminoimidazole ribonucleotide synthase n=1 Tax=Roseateles oligotrophus TaxID=1769250 RepID=A0ABT2YHN6_9BURK|nr:5-(carboxyamino)imidazole ribonucleotide synthase [Roseateles oligotrophus]MCV2369538.1 5-(carboxyamino)imidazole ribonucleotide synthase [Roseateles oligotrophus]
MKASLLPGEASLGVMGGGQLGRMFVHAAQSLGFRTVVLDPDADSPAGLVAHQHIRSDYLDVAGLTLLAQQCAAITTEFENVPAQALERLAQTRFVAPAGAAVAICQDRVAEKAHFAASAVACAPYAVIVSEADLLAVGDDLLPGILKTATLGYDGKGQVRVRSRAELAAAWSELKQVRCVLEQMLPLALEISVISARNAQGEIVQFPVQQNLHIDGILAVTQVPAPGVSAALQEQALASAARIAASMNYVGVLCVEFFILQDGRLIVNEMAPRPHNSGHYTMNACDLSQFDLQVRAMTGLPLVQPRLHSPTLMLNLLGDLWFSPAEPGVERTPAWDQVLALPGTHLHLYGKTSARPGRKMGHLNITAASAEQAESVARQAAALLGLAMDW